MQSACAVSGAASHAIFSTVSSKQRSHSIRCSATNLQCANVRSSFGIAEQIRTSTEA